MSGSPPNTALSRLSQKEKPRREPGLLPAASTGGGGNGAADTIQTRRAVLGSVPDASPIRSASVADPTKVSEIMRTLKHVEVDGRSYRDIHQAREANCTRSWLTGWRPSSKMV